MSTNSSLSINWKNVGLFLGIAVLLIHSGFTQSWNVALFTLNMGLISAIMALGVNMQWGYAGLFNVGVMGFVALGGLATVLVSMEPVPEAWEAGGVRLMIGLLSGAAAIVAAALVYNRMKPGRKRALAVTAVIFVGFVIYRMIFDPAKVAVEGVNPAGTGYLGGLGLPVFFAWPVGGLLAAGAAWIVGKTALGLRSDYLAIATLGIAEIIIAVMKNEDWLARGVKNVNGIPRAPIPREVDLQSSDSFLSVASQFGADPVTASSVAVKLAFALSFFVVLAILMWLAEKALNSPWGRMMRAIRDNEVAAEAMGKDVKKRHLHIFVLGSAVCGIAGAMMVTQDGLLTPGTYQPLRFTFLVWVMVIVGGSGNNWGAVLGGFLIWYLWAMTPVWGVNLMDAITSNMDQSGAMATRLNDMAAHMRLVTMGMILLLVMRFSPRGLIPEK